MRSACLVFTADENPALRAHRCESDDVALKNFQNSSGAEMSRVFGPVPVRLGLAASASRGRGLRAYRTARAPCLPSARQTPAAVTWVAVGQAPFLSRGGTGVLFAPKGDSFLRTHLMTIATPWFHRILCSEHDEDGDRTRRFRPGCFGGSAEALRPTPRLLQFDLQVGRPGSWSSHPHYFRQ